AATAAATTARRALFGLVDAQCATVEVLAVHPGDRLLRLVLAAHRHEGEAARAARVAIRDDLGLDDGAELGERVLKRRLVGVEGEIAYVEPGTHVIPLCSSRQRRETVGAPFSAETTEVTE